MSGVDKFGRPLREIDLEKKSAAAAVMEAIRADSDSNYTALQKRIKMLADPEDGSDAVNMRWVSARMDQLKDFLESTIQRSHELLREEIIMIRDTSKEREAAEHRLKTNEVN